VKYVGRPARDCDVSGRLSFPQLPTDDPAKAIASLIAGRHHEYPRDHSEYQKDQKPGQLRIGSAAEEALRRQHGVLGLRHNYYRPPNNCTAERERGHHESLFYDSVFVLNFAKIE
jgi:hypothetical protein